MGNCHGTSDVKILKTSSINSESFKNWPSKAAMLSSTMRTPAMRRKPSGATRHELEVIISLSSLPRQAGAVEAAAESAMPAGKTEAVGKEERAPLQKTGAIGAINTDIGREIVKRGVTESAATHEIEEAATAGTPEAAKEVTDEATQAASLPMSRAARRKAAAVDTEAKGPPATAGPLPEAAVAMR